MSDSAMSTREQILSKIRSGKPSPVDLPDVPLYPVDGDPIENFKKKLIAADGTLVEFQSRADAIAWLNERLGDGNLKVCSSLPDYRATVTPSEIGDPHNAHTLDSTVAQGVLGVGETGSVYVTDQSLGLAAAALLAHDLYLLLDRADIVDGISSAYNKLNIRGNKYGSFYTGPSATADIEAVHITGAQGPVSLTVLLYS